ncbi:peptide ABC transporter substrate-binding protein [Bacillus cereus]|uniref:Periplasmic oligopeptide-binding protein OppA n=1 Tax=Bacillus cereus TaxID=1396 RepID=A0A9X7GXZ3_BACCE|nr:peptide ABC transporter substrate-binding protein [Bacillus cereus]PGS83530.1 peptide ABC transporter substrate-binding protein [Bacillus cereus]
MQKIKGLLALIVVILIFLSACYKKNTDKVEYSTGKSASNQTLNLEANQELPTMDVTKSTDSISASILGNVMEGLYRLNKDNEPIPGMAESYTKTQDGKTYTFQIRKDAKWSNGAPVTAKDFVFAWKRLLNPKTAAEYAFIAYPLKNAKEIHEGKIAGNLLGVQAIDEHTLKVELEDPIPYFLNLMAFPSFYPLNEKFVTQNGDKFGLEADNVLYNGPFIMKEWKHEQNWKLVKNEQYWDKNTVKINEINFNVVKDPSALVNLYDSGQLDRITLSSEFVDKYKTKKNEFGSYLEPSTYFLQFNQKRNNQDTVFKNKKLRESIALVINKKPLVSTILNDGSKAVNYLVPEGLAIGPDKKDFRKSFTSGLNLDIDKAKQLWVEAKKELGRNEIKIELLNYDTGNQKKIGEYLKGEVEKNLRGITVELKPIPFKQKIKLETDQDFDFSFTAWHPDYADPMTFIDMFQTKGSLNNIGYSNNNYDEIVEKGKKEWLRDPKKRWEKLGNAEKILLEEDVAIVPLFQSGKSYVQQPNIHDIFHHNISPEYSYKWAYVNEK